MNENIQIIGSHLSIFKTVALKVEEKNRKEEAN